MKQRWLGVAAMQQPFDLLAIADIIYEVQPDIILETGEITKITASGVAALTTGMVSILSGVFTTCSSLTARALLASSVLSTVAADNGNPLHPARTVLMVGLKLGFHCHRSPVRNWPRRWT